LLSHLSILRSRTPIVGIGIDRDATTRCKEAKDLNILRIHQFHQVFHDLIDAILMEITMVTEREEIEFQALALYHPLARDIGDFDFSEVWLTSDWTE
jgi:hypothetical protein